MVKRNILTGALALGLSATAALAQMPTATLTGSITANKTLSHDTVWFLDGFVTVESGATLTIEPGTTIKGKRSSDGTLFILQGAKIMAEGTKEKPIVFTSDDPDNAKQRGGWGGVVIFGQSTVNKGSNVEFEAVKAHKYGGTVPGDNSGVLKYVRIEYAGIEIAPDEELNGLTLGGVGSGTTISHVQAHMGLDDGIEWFGGTVNSDHLVVTGQGDDAFDVDQGYSGISRWMISIQASDAGDKGIEESSASDPANNSPPTNPTWSNVTLIDNGKSGGCIDLNKNAVGSFDRFLLVGDTSAYAINLSTPFTNDALLAATPTLKFTKTHLTGSFKDNFKSDVAASSANVLALLAGVTANSLNAVKTDLTLALPALETDSVGAVVGGNKWYEGWTVASSVTYEKGVVVGIAPRAAFQGTGSIGQILVQGRELLVRASGDIKVAMTLTDLSGKVVFSDNLNLKAGENRVSHQSLQALTGGVYYMHINTGSATLGRKVAFRI